MPLWPIAVWMRTFVDKSNCPLCTPLWKNTTLKLPEKQYRKSRIGKSSESTRLPPAWPGFDSLIRRHMWVEFVGSLLCTERFSPSTPVSPLLEKPAFNLTCVNC